MNIQGAFEAIQPFNKLTHFTNFVVAHAHLALLGAFTILGVVFYRRRRAHILTD